MTKGLGKEPSANGVINVIGHVLPRLTIGGTRTAVEELRMSANLGVDWGLEGLKVQRPTRLWELSGEPINLCNSFFSLPLCCVMGGNAEHIRTT